MSIEEDIQKAAPGARVELFTINLAPLGVPTIFRFCPSSVSDVDVSFNSEVYPSRPIYAKDFEVNGQGNRPQPLMGLTNINGLAGAIVINNDDLVGALMTRIVTLRQYLDDGATPDGTAHLPIQVFEIAQKTKQNKLVVEWRLSAVNDRTEAKLPKRVVRQNICEWVYRRWDPILEQWDYSKATCPYTGVNMFTVTGAPTAEETEDACDHRVRGCVLRFGENNVLPFGGYPGVLSARTG